MPKPTDGLYINANDIAAANVGFQLLQVVLQMLVKRKALDGPELKEVFDEMEKFWSRTDDPRRKPIAKSAKEAIAQIRSLYDVPPKAAQN